MSFNLKEDFKTIEELRETPDALLEQTRKTGRPLVITANGKPTAILLSVDEFERMVHAECLSRLLAEGMDDIEAGRTIPLDKFLSEFQRVKKIPRPTQRSRRK